jgi:hypothetical protein
MPPLILLGALAGIPLLVTAGLRIKPLYVFVSLVTGYFLVAFLGDTATLTFSSFVHAAHADTIVQMALLILPLAITALLMRRTLSAAALPFQFILLLADSLMLAAFILPLLTPGTQGAVYATPYGHVVHQAHDIIIAGVAVLHVLVMWIMRPRHHEDHHGHHGKKHR